MLARCVLLCWLASVSALADEVALARIGDGWSYFPGVVPPSNGPGEWVMPGFDDSLWRTGRSGFSAGYASGEATLLPEFEGPHAAVFFRHAFVLTNVPAIKWLTLRIDYSHGFAAFLNGREIARRNLEGAPGKLPPFNALATGFHARGEPEEIDATFALEALVPGQNVLAVQVHRHPQNAALCLAAELLANFNRAPFIQNMSSNQVQIIWKTLVPSDTHVEFGTNFALGSAIFDPAPATTHVATLTNLNPDTVYQYQASSSADGKTAVFGPASFHTFKTAGPLTFVAMGDGGWNSLAQYQLADVIRESKPDLVLETGDIVYPSFTAALADPRCFSVYQDHMAATPYYFVIGNHDLYAGVGHYLEAFYLPTNSVAAAEHAAAGTSPEHYYSFDHGDAHFTVLFVPFISQHQVREGDAQYRWLTNDLAATRQPWKIVLFHTPMNSSSGHRFDDMNVNGLADRLEIRDVLLPVLSRYGVQLVLCGHEHGYERFNPVGGVHSITTAGAGVQLYGFTELDAASALFWSRYNCVRVAIDGDALEAEALGPDGEIFDRMTIRRGLPDSQSYRAAWHAPSFPEIAANDTDGNVFGQAFDFRGDPIPALTGRASNLGRAYVNHDGTNLYVGFEQVMIYGDQSIFVFIESPRLTGVEDLTTLGNGVLDPDGEGADGLDFLSNLTFTSFRPGVGCILGDEHADGQFRSFRRRQSDLHAGQGVFKLNSTFEDVPGTKLQQFHLSPQTMGAVDEENANFIQLAIPFAELGDVKPGDVLRIGAVVGGAELDPASQSRYLDSGFLGARFLRDELGSAARLEGVPVLLEFNPDADEDGDGLSRSDELALGTDPARADTDGDTLPDGWEIEHRLDPLSAVGEAAAAGDPDQDGASNVDEWQAGTDPRASESVLRLSLEILTNHKARITWLGVAGREYQVQATAGSFTNFTGVNGAAQLVSTVSTNLSYDLDLLDIQAARRFYRVFVPPKDVAPNK